jgi:predicted nucleic acid-binding protein
MYPVDASVWVNAFEQREAGHAASRQFLELVRQRSLAIVVPTLVLAEVAGAISRTRQDPAGAQAFGQALSQLSGVTLRSLDPTLANRALLLAAQHGLRGADAVYAAVAAEVGCRLVTLDAEQLTRLAGVVTAVTPAAVVAELTAMPEAPP